MIKNLISIILLFINITAVFSQVEGELKFHAGQQISLFGFKGFETIELSKTTIGSNGEFALSYDSYSGLGFLKTSDNSSFYVVLNENEVKLKGTHLTEPDSVVFLSSKENKLFMQYVTEHGTRENVLAGWKHLLPLYKTDPLFVNQKNEVLTIDKEIARIEKQDKDFINRLDKKSYVAFFIPLRKLISDMPVSVKKNTARISNHISEFRSIDFNNPFIYTSGIMDDLLEGHYWMIENSGMTKDSMYQEMNLSTDYVLANLSANEKVFNEVVDYLFDFLEKRSLFLASEHLALKALTQNSCTLDNELTNHLETYRVMKVGNVAPDITFSGTKILKGMEIPTEFKLSTMNNKYTLLVFGASWCHKCSEDLPKIASFYSKWKQKGVEVVLISLDRDKLEFEKFVNVFPWLSVCDYKVWESSTVKDYYVFSTPTMYLLDSKREIIVRPISVQQVDSWVENRIQ